MTHCSAVTNHRKKSQLSLIRQVFEGMVYVYTGIPLEIVAIFKFKLIATALPLTWVLKCICM